MGRAFHHASGEDRFSRWDDESFMDTLDSLVSNENNLVLVMDDNGFVCGMCAILCQPLYFNNHQMSSHELFTWVDEGHRAHGLEMFDMMEEWARDRAEFMTVARIPGLRDEALNRYYISKGFVPTENFYTKALNA